DRIQHNDHLAVRQTTLQKLVMNVLAIGGEDRSSADEAPQHRESGFENRESERNYRNRDGNHGRSFLCTLERERAQDKADEQAAAVTQENGRGIEVETQESQDRAGQGNGQQRYQSRSAKDSNDKNDQG